MRSTGVAAVASLRTVGLFAERGNKQFTNCKYDSAIVSTRGSMK